MRWFCEGDRLIVECGRANAARFLANTLRSAGFSAISRPPAQPV